MVVAALGLITMRSNILLSMVGAAAIGLAGSAAPNVALADDIWDMMDPTWWLGLDDDDDAWRYWRYGPGRYGRGGPYGWGGPYAWGMYPPYPPPHAHAQQTRRTAKQPAPRLPE